MAKYTVKANVSNITQLEDGSFDYDQEIVSMHWTPQDEYSYRKRYHLKDSYYEGNHTERNIRQLEKYKE
jgi:hypothetical protein